LRNLLLLFIPKHSRAATAFARGVSCGIDPIEYFMRNGSGERHDAEGLPTRRTRHASYAFQRFRLLAKKGAPLPQSLVLRENLSVDARVKMEIAVRRYIDGGFSMPVLAALDERVQLQAIEAAGILPALLDEKEL
jgi:hypothetical protein